MTARATERAKLLWAEGLGWGDVLRTLRADGFSKNDAISATVELLRLPLSAAKPLVHGSDTWLDVRTADERWHDALIGKLEPQVAPRPR